MGDFFVFSVFVLLGFYFLREYMYYMMNVSKLKKKNANNSQRAKW